MISKQLCCLISVLAVLIFIAIVLIIIMTKNNMFTRFYGGTPDNMNILFIGVAPLPYKRCENGVDEKCPNEKTFDEYVDKGYTLLRIVSNSPALFDNDGNMFRRVRGITGGDIHFKILGIDKQYFTYRYPEIKEYILKPYAGGKGIQEYCFICGEHGDGESFKADGKDIEPGHVSNIKIESNDKFKFGNTEQDSYFERDQVDSTVWKSKYKYDLIYVALDCLIGLSKDRFEGILNSGGMVIAELYDNEKKEDARLEKRLLMKAQTQLNKWKGKFNPALVDSIDKNLLSLKDTLLQVYLKPEY